MKPGDVVVVVDEIECVKCRWPECDLYVEVDIIARIPDTLEPCCPMHLKEDPS